MSQVSWSCKAFDQLTPFELYRMLSLRNKVFVVEQNCVYDDTDGKDLSCFHLCGYLNDELVAYARIVPPGVSYAEPSLGRIATALAVRRKRIGQELMQKGIDIVKELYGNAGIRISAQAYLIDFYSGFGFNRIGEPYLEDDIPHIEMLLPPISNP
jgi:ElaA protein